MQGAALNRLLASRQAYATGAANLTGRLLRPRATGLGHRASAVHTEAEAGTTSTGSGAPQVVIVGGGFGGLYTAVRLGSLFWPSGKKPQVTLVDQSDRFVFKPLLYELLNGGATDAEVAPSYTQLLASSPVRFVQGRVTGALPESPLRDGGSASGGCVTLEDGTQLPYDWLVLALGAQADARGVPGVRDHAVPFNTLEDAMKVQDALCSIEAKAQSSPTVSYPPPTSSRVMIVGAGYAGVELAAVIAERLRSKGVAQTVQVQVVTPGASIMESSPLGQRQAAEQVLAGLDVQVLTGTRVQSMEPHHASGAPGSLPTSALVNLATDAGGPSGAGTSAVPVDLVLWTAGSSPATKAAREGFPFPADARGAVQTDATLRVMRHARVFALGDICLTDQGYVQDAGTPSAHPSPSPAAPTTAAATPAAGFPATAQVAFQQADYVAWNLWAAMAGRPLLPFRYQHLGSMMALGSLNAAVALPLPPLPLPLQSSLQASPLGPLLSAVGVRLTSGDASSGVTLEGPLAAALRRAAYLYRQPTQEQRMSVAGEWLQQAGTVAAGLLQGLGARGPGTGRAVQEGD